MYVLSINDLISLSSVGPGADSDVNSGHPSAASRTWERKVRRPCTDRRSTTVPRNQPVCVH